MPLCVRAAARSRPRPVLSILVCCPLLGHQGTLTPACAHAWHVPPCLRLHTRVPSIPLPAVLVKLPDLCCNTRGCLLPLLQLSDACFSREVTTPLGPHLKPLLCSLPGHSVSWAGLSLKPLCASLRMAQSIGFSYRSSQPGMAPQESPKRTPSVCTLHEPTRDATPREPQEHSTLHLFPHCNLCLHSQVFSGQPRPVPLAQLTNTSTAPMPIRDDAALALLPLDALTGMRRSQAVGGRPYCRQLQLGVHTAAHCRVSAVARHRSETRKRRTGTQLHATQMWSHPLPATTAVAPFIHAHAGGSRVCAELIAGKASKEAVCCHRRRDESNSLERQWCRRVRRFHHHLHHTAFCLGRPSQHALRQAAPFISTTVKAVPENGRKRRRRQGSAQGRDMRRVA